MPSIASLALTPFKLVTKVNVTEKSGNTITNYPIKIKLESNWRGWKIPFLDPNNIYVLNQDNNPLYYWIEKFDRNKNELIIWTKLNKLEANESTNIYIVCEKDYNPYSEFRDPNEVFIFFEDFEHGFNWIHSTNAILTSENNYEYGGRYSVKFIGNTGNNEYIERNITFPNSGIIAERKYLFFTGDTQGHLSSYIYQGSWCGPHVAVGITGASPPSRVGYLNWYDTQWHYTNYKFPVNEWVCLEVVMYLRQGIYDIYVNDTLIVKGANYHSNCDPAGKTMTLRIDLNGACGTLPDYYVDCIIYRPYVSPEPDVSIGESILIQRPIDTF